MVQIRSFTSTYSADRLPIQRHYNLLEILLSKLYNETGPPWVRHSMQPKKIAFGTLIIALLLQTTPIQPRAWVLEKDRLAPIPLSSGTIPLEPVTKTDFNSDGIFETVAILQNAAQIRSGSQVLWQSPPGWQVIEAMVTDLNHDGAPEAALLVWRPFKPWPVDAWLPAGGRIESFHDEAGDSCHLILIGWQRDKFREVWAGSALAEPVKSFFPADLNGDGRQELVTLEGSYADSRSAPARALKVWEWNGFGFSNVSGMDGRFEAMTIAYSGDGRTLILVP